MRKTNVFGKKVNQAKTLYLIIAVFVLVVAGYFTIIQVQNNKLIQLQEQEVVLQSQIDTLLATTQSETYHEISQIIQYLPNQYNQLSILNELDFVKNLSGLALATGYSVDFIENADSPFTQALPDTVKFAQIDLSMHITDPDLILDFIDNLLDQDRLYYISTMSVSYTDIGEATIQMTLYTFYNDVVLS